MEAYSIPSNETNPAQDGLVKTAEPVRPVKPRYLLGPVADTLMIGGASLIFFVATYLLVDKKTSVDSIAWTAFYLAFIINNPHFMASYVLLYWDKRKELLSNKRFLWAAIIAPGLLLSYFIYGIASSSPKLLSYAVNLMYFTVGWHYIKQIYGTMMVTNARQGYFLNTTESWILRGTLYPVWGISFFSSNLAIQQYMHYGIGYNTFQLPTWALTASYITLWASLAILVGVFGNKWIRDGKLPGPSALISLTAIYVWYLPQLYHAIFWYTIPFFHSLQYMLFVVALKKNQAADSASALSDPPASRARFVRNLALFFAVIGSTAYLTFEYLPTTMDTYIAYDRNVFGPQLFMFCFITFINIHHYFIDNVIWRRDNMLLKRFL